MSTAPRRVQRRRTRGWRMPVGAVYVGRGSQWGNPYTIAEFGRDEALSKYRAHLAIVQNCTPWVFKELRGKDLACWCALVDKDGNPVPCHADILLEMANR